MKILTVFPCWMLSLILCYAADAGETPPLAEIANPADYDQLTVKLPSEKFAKFEAQAESGDPLSIDAVLICHLYGLGTNCNAGSAYKWLQKGFAIHSPVATLYQAKCLAGYWLDFSTLDPEQASILAAQTVRFFRPLADKGSVFAQNMLAFALLTANDISGVAVCRKAAEAGDALAENTLGDLYHRGEVVPQNDDEALKWFQKAAEQGLPVAIHNVGLCHFHDLRKRNPAEGAKWFGWAAERGYGPALAMLVRCYCKGDGVATDPLAAVEWMVKAKRQQYHYDRYLDFYDPADDQLKRTPQQIVDWYIQKAKEGSADHLDIVGLFYENGFGKAADFDKAVEYYQKAVAAGHHQAIHDLVNAYIHENDGMHPHESEILKWSQRAATGECALGKKQLGDCYDYGWGTPRDCKKALELFKQAAELGLADGSLAQRIAYLKAAVQSAENEKLNLQQLEERAAKGDADAMLRISVIYDKATGIPRDPAKALEWEEKAALAGNLTACFNLGSRYAFGNGVKADPAKAYQFLKQAATTETIPHLYQFGKFLEKNPSVSPTAKAEMLQAYRLAADKGDKQSILQVARCYNWGRGVPEDCSEAIRWYEKIMDMDFRPKFEVGMILIQGRGGAEKDVKRGFALVEEAARTPKAGDPQFELGKMYHEGIVVEKDDNKATEWLNKAKANGNAAADNLLKHLNDPVPAAAPATPAAQPTPPARPEKPPAPPGNGDF